MDRRVPRRGLKRRQMLLVGGAVGGILLAGAAHLSFGLARKVTVPEDRLVIGTAQPGVFHEYIPATGTIHARTTAYIDAIEGGQVTEVLVEEGALVKAGQPLVRLKNTNLQLEVLGREAQLMEQLDRLSTAILSFQQARLGHERDLIEAKAQIDQLSKRLDRYKALLPSGAVSVESMDELTVQLTRATQLQDAVREAQAVDQKFEREQVAQLTEAVATIKKNLNMASETLQNLTVKAPIAGQLTTLEAHLGESKAQGQRIGQVDQLEDYKVTADIDEFYLGRVALGQEATTEVNGRNALLQVAKLYPEVRQRRFRVDLVFKDDSPKTLRRGQSLEMRLGLGEARKGLVVNNGPFYEDTGGAWAFVLSPSGEVASRRTIRLGRRNPEQIEVLEGLSSGERVVTSSYGSFIKFDSIRIRK
jgi:HlyD family secretion protein